MKAARLCGCVQNSRPKWCAHQEAPSQSSGYNSNDTRNRIALNVGGNLGTAASKLQHGEAHSEYAWAASRCPHIPAGSHPNGRRGRARRGHQASQGTVAPSNLQAGCGRLNQTGKTASQTTRKGIGLCYAEGPNPQRTRFAAISAASSSCARSASLLPSCNMTSAQF